VTEPDQDTELDPAMERVRRKLTRLLAVSAGIMGLGFVAVLVAVIYRVSEDTARLREPVDATIGAAPQEVRSVAVGNGTLAVVIGGDRPRIEVRRLEDGALVGTFRLEREASAE
jgi:hypothetical protein